ncbi:unnamed protein product, partial [Ectocarpus sp. 12 AP-2014]
AVSCSSCCVEATRGEGGGGGGWWWWWPAATREGELVRPPPPPPPPPPPAAAAVVEVPGVDGQAWDGGRRDAGAAEIKKEGDNRPLEATAAAGLGGAPRVGAYSAVLEYEEDGRDLVDSPLIKLWTATLPPLAHNFCGPNLSGWRGG